MRYNLETDGFGIDTFSGCWKEWNASYKHQEIRTRKGKKKSFIRNIIEYIVRD